MQIAEAVLLAGVVASFYWLLSPLRRRLERWFARRLGPAKGRARGRVVVLAARRDGTFTREDGHGS